MYISRQARNLILAAATLWASSVSASPLNLPNTLNILFTPGSGNSNENFQIDRDGSREVGIKAKERGVGELPQTNGVYQAQTGVSPFQPTSPDFATWNLDISFDFGANYLQEDLLGIIGLDFDPAPTTPSSYAQFIFDPRALPVLDPSGSPVLDGQGNPQTFTSQVVQLSWNPGFDLWSLAIDAPAAFDPNATGTYDFFAEIVSPDTGTVARASGSVNAVPLPAAAWLFLSVIGGGAVLRRRSGVGSR